MKFPNNGTKRNASVRSAHLKFALQTMVTFTSGILIAANALASPKNARLVRNGTLKTANALFDRAFTAVFLKLIYSIFLAILLE